ncbi:TetR family transcriptional regulator [Massilia sp. Root351]|jgi:TetR/AcrR family transcriptional repressor of nem operon|uniref:TetR/AcrR family transcriptional regulator n=1 Tax=Massilia sp. Root351 TaxID=1736522 RepID=UPI00070C5956|nr:TetR/AcrR family transcriptional regulator [Massilia sp. Root351]KQV80652.1 TetR family transcriptional regulator [Massilia sp. Root351]
MKVSREQAALNRERIVETAARLFREKGFDGIGVADLMKGAGLTHGGFYGHFGSKELLLAEAAAKALEKSVTTWRKLADRAPEQPVAAIAASYLSVAHRDAPGKGCAVSTLGTDAARAGPEVRKAMSDGVQAQLKLLAELEPGADGAAKRQQAIADYASMVGGLVLSRVMADPAQSEEVLAAVVAALERGRQARSA